MSPATSDHTLADYYARRAPEYDRIYAKPERQADLGELRQWVAEFATDRRVLELACGTGWWTEVLAPVAHSVTALDINPEVLLVAASRQSAGQLEVGRRNAEGGSQPAPSRDAVTNPGVAAFRQGAGQLDFAPPTPRIRWLCRDLYSREALGESFDAGFAAFWWSHVPLARLTEFLSTFHHHLGPGARVMMLDNRFVAGSSTPLSRTDAEGNTYQWRRLDDGSEREVLKNFPEPAALEAELAPWADDIRVQLLPYYWCLTYCVARIETGVRATPFPAP